MTDSMTARGGAEVEVEVAHLLHQTPSSLAAALVSGAALSVLVAAGLATLRSHAGCEDAEAAARAAAAVYWRLDPGTVAALCAAASQPLASVVAAVWLPLLLLCLHLHLVTQPVSLGRQSDPGHGSVRTVYPEHGYYG